MALVVFFKGINVGGHRTCRPAQLAAQLKHLGAVNVGAAGTLVIRRRVGRSKLRAELAARLPFPVDLVMCDGRDIVRLVSRDFFTRLPASHDVVRFVSVLSRVPRVTPTLPVVAPARGQWLLRVLARDGRFVVGQYRRRMKAIGYLAALDRMFGVAATTRNWNTMRTIAQVLTSRVED